MSRVVLTGMALNTPLGDRVDRVLDRLIAGESGIGPWKAFPPPPLAAVIGGDLSGYDISKKAGELSAALPPEPRLRMQRMFRRLPWSLKLSLLVAAEAALAADLWSIDPQDISVLVAGHNLNPRYAFDNWKKFQREPDYIDALLAVHMLDTTHAAVVSELLGSKGGIGTVGASCASGNLGLRTAMDELADGAAAVLLLAPIYDYAPSTLHSLGLMGATTEATVSRATEASRPFDPERAGFVPSHGLAAVVLEQEEAARARNVPLLAELRAVAAGSDACHRPPKPDPLEQALLIGQVLQQGKAQGRGLVSAHAASTPAGDRAEARALSIALEGHEAEVNAAKSMLGHCGWSAALIEAVLAVAQLRRGEVHGTANLGEGPTGLRMALPGAQQVDWVLNNAFGFGGLSCVSLIGRVDGSL
jgi:3-oxoacyl-(acyl-carrier-protein) synthase